MEYNKKFMKLCLYLCILTLFFACVSTPPIQKNSVEEKKDVTIQKSKKMDKREFGLLLQSFLLKGDYERALSYFENEEEVESSVLEDQATKILKLSILISANKTKEALLYFEKLEKQYENNAELLYCRVMLAQNTNDDKTKSLYLKKILSKFPNDSWALTEQGLDLYSKKNYNGAKKKFLAALTHSPKSVEALLGLARVHYMQNKLKDAEANLNLALEVQNDNSLLWAEMARVKSETNRMLIAIEDIKKAIKLDDSIPSHWMDFALYSMQLGRKEEAKEAFTQVIKLDPSSYMAYIYRAGINDEMGATKEALEDYYKIISLYPLYYFAYEGAGVIHMQKKEWENAAYCFNNALQKAPQQYHYAILVSFCLYKAGKIKEGKDFCRDYIKTMNRVEKENEYFLTRLFFENSGDSDVNNRIMKIKDKTTYYRMMYYLGAFYEAINKNVVAEKYYLDVLSAKVPSFMEYRLARIALDRIKG